MCSLYLVVMRSYKSHLSMEDSQKPQPWYGESEIQKRCLGQGDTVGGSLGLTDIKA